MDQSFCIIRLEAEVAFLGGLSDQFNGTLSVKDLGLTFLLPTMLTAT